MRSSASVSTILCVNHDSARPNTMGLRPGIGSSSTKRMTYGRPFKFSAVKLGRTMSSIGFSWKVASDCSRPRLRGGGCGNCFRTRAIFPMRGR
jgi:hypothetical protein